MQATSIEPGIFVIENKSVRVQVHGGVERKSRAGRRIPSACAAEAAQVMRVRATGDARDRVQLVHAPGDEIRDDTFLVPTENERSPPAIIHLEGRDGASSRLLLIDYEETSFPYSLYLRYLIFIGRGEYIATDF